MKWNPRIFVGLVLLLLTSCGGGGGGEPDRQQEKSSDALVMIEGQVRGAQMSVVGATFSLQSLDVIQEQDRPSQLLFRATTILSNMIVGNGGHIALQVPERKLQSASFFVVAVECKNYSSNKCNLHHPIKLIIDSQVFRAGGWLVTPVTDIAYRKVFYLLNTTADTSKIKEYLDHLAVRLFKKESGDFSAVDYSSIVFWDPVESGGSFPIQRGSLVSQYETLILQSTDPNEIAAKVNDLFRPVWGSLNTVLNSSDEYFFRDGYAYSFSADRIEVTKVESSDVAMEDSVGISSSANSGRSRIRVHGQYAYVLVDEYLKIFTVGGEQQGGLVSEIELPSRAEDIRVHEGRAYISGGAYSDLYIVNVEDPAHAFFVAMVDAEQSANSVQIFDHFIVLASDQTVQVLDLANLDSPARVGRLAVGGVIRDFVMDGDIAFFAMNVSRAVIADFSNPTVPSVIAEYRTRHHIEDMQYAGGNLYLAHSNGVEVVDVSRPAQPKRKNLISTYSRARSVRIADNMGIVNTGADGWQILDLNSPVHSVHAGFVKMPNEALGMDMWGDKLYLSSGNSGLSIVDISDVSNAAVLASVPSRGYAMDVVVNFPYAYMADGSNGISIIDVSSEQSPQFVRFVNTFGFASDIEVIRDIAYVANRNELRVYDLVNPTQPVLVDSSIDSATTLHIQDDILYISNEISGFQVVRLTSSAPELLSRNYYHWGWVNNLYFNDGFVFSASERQGIKAFDVSNPQNPVLTTQERVAGLARDIKITNNLAYVAAGDAGLQVFDVTDPYDIRFVASVDTIGAAHRIKIHQNLLFVATWEGVEIFPTINAAALFQ